MSQPAIIVDGISKKYRIGLKERPYQTFREAATGALSAPLRYARSWSQRPPDADRADFWALKDVSFEVQPGEVVGIIGRNGAGKSTLLKILSRITEPTSGEIHLQGRVASLLEVGTGFHPELTGRENIYLNGAILGMKRAEITRKFDEIVAFAETEKFLDTPVKYYSSGMYVRLAFAVAAHLEPEILIVNEVLAVGDAEFQKKCIGKMREVAAGEGRTVLFVSHNTSAIRRLCGNALWIHQGSVRAFGGTDQVLAMYAASILGAGGTRLSPCSSRAGAHAACELEIDMHPERTPVVTPGAAVRFAIKISAGSTIRNATVGIHIKAGAGDRVLCLNSRWERGFITIPAGRSVVQCVLPDNPLAPGTYSIDLGISGNGIQLEWFEDISALVIAEADYFGTGELPYPSQGHIIRRSSWKLGTGEPSYDHSHAV